jgi:hypothetical protein
MSQYKVPQDVEADDKLLGPFSFRQFVYLLIAGGLIALAVGLFQIFPFLAIIPVPFVLLLAALALPLKKDQPMETYLAAIVSYYLKPRIRRWTPGQRESTIMITAPKKQEEETRARDITGEEATHRLSFLADIVDTEGYAIKGVGGTQKVNDELVVEANMTNDIFETNHFDSLETTIAKDENDRHAKVIEEMREAIAEVEQIDGSVKLEKRDNMSYDGNDDGTSNVVPSYGSKVVVIPGSVAEEKDKEPSNMVRKIEEKPKKSEQIVAKPSIIELANNPDFTIATISKEANRIKERDEGEVFISLH